MDRYKTAETDPASNVSFTATVFEDNGSYKLRLHNVKNTADPDRTYDVSAVYGGGLWKQRYLSKVTNASGFFHAILPMQYQTSGLEHPSYGRTSRVWRDYNAANWYDETSQTFKNPVPAKSFEKNCISCHATGVQVTGSDATTWQASLLSDRVWGDFDFDGDGIRDEMNMGCETCHGPGSEHWAQAGQSKAIVSPSLLTPERESMICGQCHSRPKGALNTDSPVNAQGLMMRAGTARSQFLMEYATSQLDGAPKDFYADEAKHSKSHHQQYSDFIRSGMYKNDRQLMTCSDCHNPHERANVRQLRSDPSDQRASCGNSCHDSQVNDQLAHVTDKLGPDYGISMATTPCSTCHMPKAAKTGAGEPGIVVDGIQYWTNDVSSHLFDVPLKTAAAKPPVGVDMPTAYTNACGRACHDAMPN